LLVAAAVVLLAKPVEHLAELYGSPFRLNGLGVAWSVAVLGVSVSLAWFGSWLAASWHIRAIEPQ
jgi:cell division transport system permease protein